MIKVLFTAFLFSAVLLPEKEESLDNGKHFHHSFDDNTLLCISNGECYSKKEFSVICTKNNIKKDKNSYREFYILYIRMKLKIATALDLKMDQTETFKTELNGYAQQLKKGYKGMTDEEIENNDSYKIQLNEYHDGLLLFNIMDEKIWKHASSDNIEVLEYFNKHPEKYPNAIFEDIRGQVASDYSAGLEENWITELKEKYAYRTNKDVYDAIYDELKN